MSPSADPSVDGRRLVVSDRRVFITCRVLPRRRILSESEFARTAQVIQERRAEHHFLLSAWVFLPDHWHAIFSPPHPLTISRVMESIKDGSTKRIKRSQGGVAQGRSRRKGRTGLRVTCTLRKRRSYRSYTSLR